MMPSMPKRPVDYDLIAIFISVAEEKSFSKAANQLGIGKGTVSRAVAGLEQLLGAELIHRTTHAVALSTAGTALYERTAKHLRALDEAIGHLPEPGERPAGVLRLTAPAAFSAVILPDVLAQFALRYPEVSFELHITNTNVDLIAQGFDVAIRSLQPGTKQSMLKVRRLGYVNGGLYAAPSYLARRGHPKTISRDHEWVLQTGTAQRWKVPRDQVRFLCDDFVAMRELASQGAGITFLPNYLAAPYVRSGKLEHVLLTGPSLNVPLFMLYPSRGQVARKVTAFRDFLIEWLRKTPLD
jgi:DNA-binding transcriptional LysR family regulator